MIILILCIFLYFRMRCWIYHTFKSMAEKYLVYEIVKYTCWKTKIYLTFLLHFYAVSCFLGSFMILNVNKLFSNSILLRFASSTKLLNISIFIMVFIYLILIYESLLKRDFGTLEIYYLGELAFGDETVDVRGDRLCGSRESSGIRVKQPHIEPVYGGELGYTRAHLATAHHAYSLDLRHVCFTLLNDQWFWSLRSWYRW